MQTVGQVRADGDVGTLAPSSTPGWAPIPAPPSSPYALTRPASATQPPQSPSADGPPLEVGGARTPSRRNGGAAATSKCPSGLRRPSTIMPSMIDLQLRHRKAFPTAGFALVLDLHPRNSRRHHRCHRIVASSNSAVSYTMVQ